MHKEDNVPWESHVYFRNEDGSTLQNYLWFSKVRKNIWFCPHVQKNAISCLWMVWLCMWKIQKNQKHLEIISNILKWISVN